MIKILSAAMMGCVLFVGAGHAADIRVLTTGAAKPVVLAIAAEFEAKTGDHLIVQNDTAGAVVKRITAGEAFDFVIAAKPGMAGLVKDSRIMADSAIDLLRANISLAIKSGAPAPDISTVAAFKTTLLNAKSITFVDPASGGSGGIYLVGLFERMGIADALKPKLVLANGGLAGELVADGKAEIVLQGGSELMPVKGITIVGPIPAEVNNNTVYSGGVVVGSKVAAEAAKLLAMLKRPEMAGVLAANGLLMP